jgi:crossover junction endodeoxyribonuclease RuvC
VHHSCLQTDRQDDFADRLQVLRDEVTAVIKKFKPECVAVERLFFQTNAKTAIKVGMARGVIFLAIADAELSIVEVAPSQLKQGITGWGGAGKRGVQEMVKRFLHLKDIPKPDDAADALAIAIVGGMLYRQPLLRA